MKAALFDLDGTLIDSDDAIVWCVNALLAELGRPPVPAENIVRLIGVGLTPLLARFLPDPEAHVVEYRRLYRQGFAARTKILTGAPQLLIELRHQGVSTAVVTNRNQELAAVILRGVGLFEYFDEVIGEGAGWPLKPDPAVILEACRRFGAAPDETWYVGDTDIDVRAGRNAGCVTVLVGRKVVANSAEADLVIGSLNELIEHL